MEHKKEFENYLKSIGELDEPNDYGDYSVTQDYINFVDNKIKQIESEKEQLIKAASDYIDVTRHLKPCPGTLNKLLKLIYKLNKG